MKKIATLCSALILVLAASVTLAACGNKSTAPGVVASFSITGNEDAVTLNWAAPTNKGGKAITSYQITTNNWDTQISRTATQLSYTVDVEIGETYTFKIRAVNKKGAGAEKSITAEVVGKQADWVYIYYGHPDQATGERIQSWEYDENVTSYTLFGDYDIGEGEQILENFVITLGTELDSTHYVKINNVLSFDFIEFFDGIGYNNIYMFANGTTITENGIVYLNSSNTTDTIEQY